MEKIEEYKIQLIDAIVKTCLDRGIPINLNLAREEAEELLDSFVASAISNNKEANDIYIDVSVSSAINSYQLITRLPIEDRILFVNGMNIGTQLLSDMKSENNYDGKSLQEKMQLALNMYESFKKEFGIEDNEKNFYTMLGIKDIIEIMHNYDNNKQKENKKSNK